ncbi:hypothetical protein BLOT_011805 [Blomia tropicalis]|nr:hypothetical protein BLOT_011805 [Blomia tropicalis]
MRRNSINNGIQRPFDFTFFHWIEQGIEQSPCKMPQRKISNQNDCIESSYVPLSKKILKRCESNDAPFFSVEFFPPKTAGGANNLISRLENFRQLGPLFADITWHEAGNPAGDSPTSSITIAGIALNYCCLNTMLHITCIGMKRDKLARCLERAKSLGIRNILALRGDKNSKDDDENCDFHYAIDLIRFTKEMFGDYFTIAVAGYPTTHPESESKESDLLHLKEKVDAGADFIITQLFFESKVFFQFVSDCRNVGITVPILPGILPIQSYDSLEKITKISKLTIPEQIIHDLHPFKNNDEAIRNYGIDWTIQLCREILLAGITPGIHFYTLNRQQATVSIVKALNLAVTTPMKPLPWSTSANYRRCNETVRPIFWSARPKSYVCRTNTWDEFPNGRWGHIDSPAFGSLNDYYMFLEPKKKKEVLLKQWGLEINAEENVWEIFHCYLTGNPNRHGICVDSIPWNDSSLREETGIIIDRLAYFNSKGILTINSQPNVNGVGSSDPIFGWGSPDGYVYQKAYLEFFINEQMAHELLRILEGYDPRVNYLITNQRGDYFESNCLEDGQTNAVTWGVFPGKEIIQPTIVDSVSFQVWKDEAFDLWFSKWGKLYSKESNSYQMIKHIHDTYYLVCLVDNDYPKETCLWTILEQIIH